jgi:ArsR family transcriptional regulator
MEQIYLDTARILKAISDPKRLKIVDMLSCKEQCANKLQQAFAITQPTLSHDMKVLVESGLIIDRRDGKNIFYSLNPAAMEEPEPCKMGARSTDGKQSTDSGESIRRN